MGKSSLTRADISEAVFEQIGLSRQESAALVESILDHVCDALVEEQQVKVASFGTFMVRSKNPRVGRNPKTGVEAPISARKVISFRASQVLKSRINGTWDGQLEGEDVEHGDD